MAATSTTEFRSRIRAAIADNQLQKALDDNASRRSAGRALALATLPDAAGNRQDARAVRTETLERLPELLAEFTKSAEANGMRVHRAADAAHALQLVTQIAEQASDSHNGQGKNALLFAKSKSMISEEIELNAELERRGHRVVETDLGEYIVQLRGEKPAHIITPAVHLQRHQVGALFRDKLGLPYTEDIPTLIAAARSAMREVFLKADIGISGVNFGVAETGGICIVTNEGNGRMVATLPRVHIALMGMERLVPTLQDLALMLSLLPRSATGQKLSVYTQLIHGPRSEGELDGALQRHVIIVDNGRSRLRNSSLREALYCIRCGACLNACPVFREIGGHAYVGPDGRAAPYPGPIGSVISPGLAGLHEFGQLAQASSLCGACKDACPIDIDLPAMLTRVRAGAPENKGDGAAVGLSLGTRVALKGYTLIATAPRFFGIMQTLGGLGARLFSPLAEWMRLPGWTGWGLSKDIKRPAIRSFRDRWRALEAVSNVSVSSNHGAVKASGRQMLKDHPRAFETAEGGEDRAALAGTFATELQALGARVLRLGHRDLTDRVIEEVRLHGADRVVCWEDIDGLTPERLAAAGITLVSRPDPEIRVGITGCTCAVAQTGTLLLSSQPGMALSTSLLPETHIAVVYVSQILPSLEAAMRVPRLRRSSASVLITGPSRTADIEMTLTIGVHGPKELIVLITD